MVKSLENLLATLDETRSSIICRHPHGATRVYPRAFQVGPRVAINAEVEVEGASAGAITLTPNLPSRIPGWREERRRVARELAAQFGVDFTRECTQQWSKDGYEIRYEEAWGDFSFAITPRP